MNRRHILLISPAFHGYWRSIADALTRRGHSVTVHVYDDYASLGAKVRNKALYELPTRLHSGSGMARLRRDTTANALARLTATRFDTVLAIKGDLIGQEFWEEVRRKGLDHTLWLYDEVRRNAYTEAELQTFPAIVSYSRLDVAALTERGLDVHYVPNAFDHTIKFSVTRSPEVVFVGARYPDRERLLTTLRQHEVPVRAYGRQWSQHWFDRIRTWELRRPTLPSGRDVDRATAYGLISGAVASLNSHTDQDGFTMRTFEIPGAGGLQLIDRPDVDEFYEPGTEVAVFGSEDELVELAQRASADRRWAQSLADQGRRRTLAHHTFDHRAQSLEALWV